MSVNRMHAAIQFAALAQGQQMRKGSEVPYLAHPFEVAQLLTAAAAPKELILAGLLHDTVLERSLSVMRGIVLLHDSSGKQTTVDALQDVITGLQEQGFTFAPLTNEVRPIRFFYRE